MSDRDLQSDFISLDVGPDMTLNDIKAFVEAEINVPPSSQIFLQDGRPVTDTSMTLAQLNVNEGDVVAMAIQSDRRRPAPAAPSTAQPSAPRTTTGNEAEQLRQRLLSDAVVMAECRRQDPELAAASSDQQKFLDLWTARRKQFDQMQREKEEQIALLEADPFNVEAQQKIEEMIRQQRVAENLQKAMEEFPEGVCANPRGVEELTNWPCSFWQSDHALHRRRRQQCSDQSVCGFWGTNNHHVSFGGRTLWHPSTG